MNATKWIATALGLCLTLFVSACVAGMSREVPPQSLQGNSKLAIKNAVAPVLGPYQSVTATPKIILTARAIREQAMHDLAASATADAAAAQSITAVAELPAATITAEPTSEPTAEPTVEPTAPIVAPTALPAIVKLTSADALSTDPKQALLQLVAQQFTMPQQRMRTVAKGPAGRTEHVLESIGDDQWHEMSDVDGVVTEIYQIGAKQFRNEGHGWIIANAPNPLPDAALRARDAVASIDLLASDVELEGEYELSGRATLLFYYAFNKQGSGTARIWFDRATLAPVRTEVTLLDGTQIVTEYAYGDAVVIRVPGQGW